MSTNDDAAQGNAVDQEVRRVCAILQSIAANYAPDSDEALAIRDAALAYTIVQQREMLQKQYWRLRLAFGGHLSEKVKADLRRQGIEPDDFDDEVT
jgi:hypothetical protein